MVVIMKQGVSQQEIDKLSAALTAQGVQVNPVYGTDVTILGLVGDTSHIDQDWIAANRNVERVMHVNEPFKKANRKFHPADTVIQVGDQQIGGSRLAVIAGPCSVENREQICYVAQAVKEAGAPTSCGAAPSSPAPPPMPSRGSNMRGWSC